MNPLANFTLRTKLVTAFVLVALIPIGILAILNAQTRREGLIKTANRSLYAVAAQTAANVDAFIEDNRNAVETHAQLPALTTFLSLPAEERIESAVEQEILALLRTLARRHTLILSYALLDSQGITVVDTVSENQGLDQSIQPYFTAFQTEESTELTYVSPVTFSPSTGLPSIFFSSPIFDATDELVGVLRIQYDASVLQELVVMKSGQSGKGSFGVLFDEHHIHLAHSQQPSVNYLPIVHLPDDVVFALKQAHRLPNLPNSQLFSMQLDQLHAYLSDPDTHRFFAAKDVSTGDLINQVAVAKLTSMPWLIAFFQPQTQFLEPIRKQLTDGILFSMFIAIFAIGAAGIMAQLLAKPILQLANTVTHFSQGYIDVRTPINTKDEIGVLATNFNTMAEQVGNLLNGLEERTQELETSQRISLALSELTKAVTDPDLLLRAAEALMKDRFGLRVFFYLLDDNLQNLTLQGDYDQESDTKLPVTQISMTDDENLIARAARSYRLLREIEANLDIVESPDPSTPESNPEVAVPLVAGGMLLGVLAIYDQQEDGFSQTDLNTFNTLASHIATVLRNAQLFEETQAAKEEAEGASAYLTTIIDNLVDGLLVTDVEGNVTRFNPALTTMLDLNASDILGQDSQNAFNEDVAQLIQEAQQNRTVVFTEEVSLAQGRVGKAVATAIRRNRAISDSASLGSAVMIRDITEEKEVDRMKTDFISTVSHELRTPLTSVLGFAKIIRKRLDDVIFPNFNPDDKKATRATKQIDKNIDIIISEGERLTMLINDVLDIAKMESGQVEWRMEPLSIPELIDRAILATSALFEGTDVALIQDVPANLPVLVGDKNRLLQVLINLISNASKFTETGYVTCKAQFTEQTIEISVIDTGSGIAEADQAKVFERFKQVGDTMTDKPSGTGLGLPICKQIIEHHQGHIWVKSSVGQGSTFTFTLPLHPTNHARADALTKSMDISTLVQQLEAHGVTSADTTIATNQQTILVVDDEPHIRELLRQELESKGYQVEEATDGFDAIVKAKQIEPDLITLDVMMPEIGGFDVAAVLKNNPHTADIPIIILSIVQDQVRGFRLGVDRYLNKPVSADELVSEVEKLLSQGQSRKRVMVVDQENNTLRTLSDVLTAQGYQVTEAASDRNLLENAALAKPDMIILDSLMMDQHEEIVKALRFEKNLENVLLFFFQEPSEESD